MLKGNRMRNKKMMVPRMKKMRVLRKKALWDLKNKNHKKKRRFIQNR
jgi:hypothetical protein